MSRALFEAALADSHSLERDPLSPDKYIYQNINEYWVVWQKAVAALAQPEPQPVLWIMTTPLGGTKLVIESESEAKRFAAMDGRSVVPLYAAPPSPEPSDADRLDAQRYRFMRDLSATGQTPDEFTAAIDAAMAAPKPGEKA